METRKKIQTKFDGCQIFIKSSLKGIIPKKNSFTLIRTKPLENRIIKSYIQVIESILPEDLIFGSLSSDPRNLLSCIEEVTHKITKKELFNVDVVLGVEETLKTLCKRTSLTNVILIKLHSISDRLLDRASSKSLLEVLLGMLADLVLNATFLPSYVSITSDNIQNISQEEFFNISENVPVILQINEYFVPVVPKWSLFYCNNYEEILRINIDCVPGLKKLLNEYYSGNQMVDVLERDIEPVLQAYYSQAIKQNNLILYQSYYNKICEDFKEYLQFLGKQENELNQDARLKLNYYVNEMEVMLLLVLQKGLLQNPKWILDPEGYSFLLTEAFFIKLSRQTLNFAKSSEFLEELENKVFEIMRNFLAKTKHNKYAVLFVQKKEGFSDADYIQHLHSECNALLKTMQISDWIKLYFSGRMNAAQELEELTKIVTGFFSSLENYRKFFADLENAIEFRLKLKAKLENSLLEQKKVYKNILIELSESLNHKTEKEADLLLEGFNQLLQLDNLTEEERKFLKMQEMAVRREGKKTKNETLTGAAEYQPIFSVVQSKSNPPRNFAYFLQRAEQGDKIAQYNLAVCFDKGDGVMKNEKKAFEYYQMAAQQDYAPAQYNLGVCYEDGTGVEMNTNMAMKFYQLAADQGDLVAKDAFQRLTSSTYNPF